jgi:predicted DNA-binding protein YlxM (UPF0122 family)
LSWYGGLLTDRQREVVSSYYDYDLSLGEIAENIGITRQAVLDCLHKACLILDEYESKLGNYVRSTRITDALNGVKELIDEGKTEEAKAAIDEIKETI